MSRYNQSAPLHQLLDLAPVLSSGELNPEDVHYAFSNDEVARRPGMASQFETALGRTEKQDYQEATNRTAIVVGESSLAANLAEDNLPEDTIIVLDSSDDMCKYMGRYTEGLLTSRSPRSWVDYMMPVGRLPVSEQAKFQFVGRLVDQITEWEAMTNRPHALNEPSPPETFLAAQKAVSEKAIIPWRADIMDPIAMAKLGAVLRLLDATVTFVNATNVVPHTRYYRPGVTPALDSLPLTGSAPILTAACNDKYPRKVLSVGHYTFRSLITRSAGVFNGLGEFKYKGGAIGERKLDTPAIRYAELANTDVAAKGLLAIALGT